MQAQNPGNSGNPGNQQNSSSNQKPTLTWSQPAAGTNMGAKSSTSTTPNNSATPHVVSSAERSATSAYIGVFVAGLVVGILVGWGITGLRTSGSSPVSTTAATSSSAMAINSQSTSSMATSSMNLSGATIGSANASASAGSQTLTVTSPQTAGSHVSISKVIVSQPTWVAIYTDVNGTKGSILGAQMFFPASMGGVQSGVVTLLQPTVAGNTYLVGELLDNGSHQFSVQSDKVVTINGSSILGQFKAQ